MNRPDVLIWGYQINRVHCTHPECLKLHQRRTQAVAAGLWNHVTRIERELSYCAKTPTEGLMS